MTCTPERRRRLVRSSGRRGRSDLGPPRLDVARGTARMEPTPPSRGPDSSEGAEHDELAANHRCERRDARSRRRPDGATVSDSARCASPATGSGVNHADRDGAKAMLRRAIELGVNFIDTADSYGPDVSETLIGETLHPVPKRSRHRDEGRSGAHRSRALAGQRPARAPARRMRGQPAAAPLDQIPLYQFHRPDPAVPLEDSISALVELKERARSAHRGVQRHRGPASARAADHPDRVGAEPLQRHRPRTRSRSSICASRRVWRSCRGRRSWISTALRSCARSPSRHGATARQVVLAWLLARSPAMLPIPGTGSVGHLESNVAAAGVELPGRGGRGDHQATAHHLKLVVAAAFVALGSYAMRPSWRAAVRSSRTAQCSTIWPS